MPLYFKKSLQVKLVIVIIVVSSLINGVASGLKIFEDRKEALLQMATNIERVLNELEHGLADPLWNFNIEQAKTLVELKLKERDFLGITIYDLETKNRIFRMVKGEFEIVESDSIIIDFTQQKTILIKKNGTPFWKADCYFTDRFVQEVITSDIKYSLVTIIVMSLVLTFLLIVTLNYLVTSPIRKTTELVKHIAEGDFSKRISVRQSDEIGEIGNEVNSLLDQLESTISEVNRVMEAMATGDFSKKMTVDLSGDLSNLKNHTNRSIDILSERTDQLKNAQRELIDKAHKAGMADVASGTLHNVGNILNSVKVSAQVILNDIDSSNIDGFQKANNLLRENYSSIEDFILNDPKGMKLLDYYLKLENVLFAEKEQIRENLVRLSYKIDMIADVILAQQTYAGINSLTEYYPLETIIEDALILQSETIDRYGIQVIKKISLLPSIPIQKNKLVHIMINLIKNAKESMLDTPVDKRKLTISVEKSSNLVYLKIQDTGKGIEQSRLNKVFTHGFTTKKDGHGFGLHSCANYMTEMRGRIWAESDGIDKGATFVLEFQLAQKVQVD